MSYDHPKGYRAVKTTVFAQVEATRFTTRFDSKQHKTVPTVDSIRVAAINQKRPDKPKAGCIVVELTIQMPEAAFLPMQPTAIIDIPDTFTAIAALVEVETADQNEEDVVAAWAQAATEKP